MRTPKLHLREFFWLVVVVGLALGWWNDQERLRREREALDAAQHNFNDERETYLLAVRRLKAIQVRRAAAAVSVAEAELALTQEIRRKNPQAVPELELSRLQAQFDLAKSEWEEVFARAELSKP